MRGLRQDDVQFLAALNCDEDVMRFVHDGTQEMEQALVAAQLEVGWARKGQWRKWIIEELANPGIAIGWIQLYVEHGGYQLGFQFCPDVWGRGFATESIASVVEYAFTTMELEQVGASVQQANVASKRALERNGFHPIGEGMDGYRPTDEYYLSVEDFRSLQKWTSAGSQSPQAPAQS